MKSCGDHYLAITQKSAFFAEVELNGFWRNMSALPGSLWLHSFAHLSLREAARLRCVCAAWRTVLSTRPLTMPMDVVLLSGIDQTHELPFVLRQRLRSLSIFFEAKFPFGSFQDCRQPIRKLAETARIPSVHVQIEAESLRWHAAGLLLDGPLCTHATSVRFSGFSLPPPHLRSWLNSNLGCLTELVDEASYWDHSTLQTLARQDWAPRLTSLALRLVGSTRGGEPERSLGECLAVCSSLEQLHLLRMDGTEAAWDALSRATRLRRLTVVDPISTTLDDALLLRLTRLERLEELTVKLRYVSKLPNLDVRQKFKVLRELSVHTELD